MLPLVLPVTLAGAVAVVAAAVFYPTVDMRGWTTVGLLALVAASVVAEALPVPIQGVHVGATSLATIFIAGAAVLYGWAPAVLLAFTTMAIVELHRRRPPMHVAYNAALYSLSALAAGWVADVFVDLGGLWELLLAPALGALAFYLVDIGLLSAVVARSTRVSVVGTFSRYLRMTGLPFAIMASVTVLLVEVWNRSAPLTAALVGPLVAIALYQRSVHRALEAMRLARTDPLTGLGNPRAFDEQLQRELETARADGRQLTLCMLDVDDFKQINDTHGHAAGDSVLAEIAARLRRSGETFRLGGDEFALVLPGHDAEEGCAAARSVIERVVAEGYEYGIVPGISAGIAVMK